MKQLDNLEEYTDNEIANLDKYKSPNIEEIEKLWLRYVVIGLLFFILSVLYFVVSPVLYIEKWGEQDEIKNKIIIETLKTIGLFIGGGLGLYSIYLGYKRAIAMENTAIAANKTAEAALKNAEAANKTAEANLKNAQVAEDKQITECFSKAIEQLASDKIEVRLGAIYTLERIAKDSPKDRLTVMKVLTAFVRENALLNSELIQNAIHLNFTKDKERTLKKISLDIKEAFTVIQNNQKNEQLNLSHINFFQAELSHFDFKGLSLKSANFAEVFFLEVDFAEADLAFANLSGSILINSDFKAANLTGANLTRAKLIETNLIKANLSFADLVEAELSQANLIGANLAGANLTGANFAGN
ncbi:pentapeptide repeat-containing protein [Nostoc sp. CHAB 5834]|nr:pentapeptide repeat-containing protein [Nostoc sp. CHAB 5834]